jgi:hypothetical protein
MAKKAEWGTVGTSSHGVDTGQLTDKTKMSKSKDWQDVDQGWDVPESAV